MPYLAALDSIAPDGVGRDEVTALIRSRISFLRTCAERASDISAIFRRRRDGDEAVALRPSKDADLAVRSEALVEAAQWLFSLGETRDGIDTLASAMKTVPPMTADADPLEIARVSLLSAIAERQNRDPADGTTSPWPLKRSFEALPMRRLARLLAAGGIPVTGYSFAGETPYFSPASAAPEAAIIERIDQQRFGYAFSPVPLRHDDAAAVSAILAMERNYAVRIAMIAQDWRDRALSDAGLERRIPYLRAELIDWRLLASHIALARAGLRFELPETRDEMGAVAFMRGLAQGWAPEEGRAA